eukprot:scaffold52791_cov29-Prasinocladus_malaysianus.AAC.1
MNQWTVFHSTVPCTLNGYKWPCEGGEVAAKQSAEKKPRKCTRGSDCAVASHNINDPTNLKAQSKTHPGRHMDLIDKVHQVLKLSTADYQLKAPYSCYAINLRPNRARRAAQCRPQTISNKHHVIPGDYPAT